jgi:predicted dehydrogenase
VAERVRWGILGAANIAAWQFIPAVRASRRGALVAVAARDAARAREFAARHGIPRAHAGYEALLADPEVDAVYIALPNALHAAWTEAAARAGKHVFCEKPFAANAPEAARAVAACEAAGVLCMEAFVYRYHPQTQRLERWLREGAIGTVRTVHAAFHFVLGGERRRTDIRMQAALAGGALMDVGCYAVNWLRLVFGEEPQQATAVAVWDPERGVDTQLVGMLHFSGGRAGTLSCGFDMPGTVATRVVGTEGEIVVSQPYHPRGQEATVALRRLGQAEEVYRDARDEPPFLAAVEHFHDCLLDGRPPRLTARDAIGNMAAIDALLRSARAGGATRPVELPGGSPRDPSGSALSRGG